MTITGPWGLPQTSSDAYCELGSMVTTKVPCYQPGRPTETLQNLYMLLGQRLRVLHWK